MGSSSARAMGSVCSASTNSLCLASRAAMNCSAISIEVKEEVIDSALGKLLIAGTEKGVCAIRFGDTRAALEQTLRDEFAQARLEHDPHSLEPWTERLRDHLGGNPAQPGLPLDIQATAFQRLVWEHLRTIPRGQTESYSEVARSVGRPKAVRAVARACASNPVAVAIPCHRVVREDGALGGYRGGIAQKEKLLEMESQPRR